MTVSNFVPKTSWLAQLAKKYPDVIVKLESLFNKPTYVYIDYANVAGWHQKLRWTTDIKRLSQFLNSFANIKKIRFYYGTIRGDTNSETRMVIAKKYYRRDLETKDVKIKKISIDVSSISPQSPDLLNQFIRKPLLDKLILADLEYLNDRLRTLNQSGILYLEDKKCNFDVEIGIRMYRDRIDHPEIETFALWSGDCDFEAPIKDIITSGKRALVFAPRGHISTELGESGATIYEIRPLKNFICWPRQIDIPLK